MSEQELGSKTTTLSGHTVFFDLETGGVSDESPNIQLAAVVVDSNFSEIETGEWKIQFDAAACDPEALQINHWDENVWAEQAKRPEVVLGQFHAMLERHKTRTLISKRTGRPYSVAQLAGHNIDTFDLPRLRRWYGSRFMPASMIGLDTLQLAYWYFSTVSEKPSNFQLSTLIAHLGLSADGAHDALADVRMSIQLTKELTCRIKSWEARQLSFMETQAWASR